MMLIYVIIYGIIKERVLKAHLNIA
jgi:hypothetical protein